ncbi:MAG: hypothetical protein ACAH80_00725 [Alphaproteobacteria bacterium]
MKIAITLALLLLLSPTPAYACIPDSNIFQFEALVPYVILLPLLLVLKIAIYALAGEGALFKAMFRAAGIPAIGGALIIVVQLPSFPYFAAAMIGIFTIFAFGDLKYFREKYAGRPPMRVRHALFWGNLLLSFLLLASFTFLSRAVQGCIG